MRNDEEVLREKETETLDVSDIRLRTKIRGRLHENITRNGAIPRGKLAANILLDIHKKDKHYTLNVAD